MKTQPIKIKRHPNGLIAVDQGSVAGRMITFNPDDSMFYVHKHRSDDVLGIFPRMAAAVRFARMLGSLGHPPRKATDPEPPPGAYAFTADGRFVSGTGYGGERR